MDQNIKILFAIVIAIHGIGHLIGITFLSESINFQGFKNDSWLLTEQLGLNKILTQVLALLWLIVAVGLMDNQPRIP